MVVITEALLCALLVHSRCSSISFLSSVCVCPQRVVTVTRKGIKWGQLLLIGGADSLELSSNTIAHVLTCVHVHTTAFHIIKCFPVAACQRKMLLGFSSSQCSE